MIETQTPLLVRAVRSRWTQSRSGVPLASPRGPTDTKLSAAGADTQATPHSSTVLSPRDFRGRAGHGRVHAE